MAVDESPPVDFLFENNFQKNRWDTVDGWNPAPPGMYETL